MNYIKPDQNEMERFADECRVFCDDPRTRRLAAEVLRLHKMLRSADIEQGRDYLTISLRVSAAALAFSLDPEREIMDLARSAGDRMVRELRMQNEARRILPTVDGKDGG